MKDHTHLRERVAKAALDMLELTEGDMSGWRVLPTSQIMYGLPLPNGLTLVIHLEPYADSNLWLGHCARERILVYWLRDDPEPA